MIWQFDNSNTCLFGSLHVLKDGANPYSKQIDNIYSRSTRIILEANFENMDMSILTYNNGQKLSDNIPQKLYLKTKAKWMKCGFSALELEITKPWQVANKLNMNLLEKRGFTFEGGIDNQLLIQAKKDNKEIVFLEPANTAFDCFNNAPAHEQTEYLSGIVNNPDSVIEKFRILLKAWSTTDIDQLSIILQECIERLPVLYQALIADRNTAWLNEIATNIKSGGNILIAVGALHCVGDMYNVQSLIRDIHGHGSNLIN